MHKLCDCIKPRDSDREIIDESTVVLVCGVCLRLFHPLYFLFKPSDPQLTKRSPVDMVIKSHSRHRVMRMGSHFSALPHGLMGTSIETQRSRYHADAYTHQTQYSLLFIFPHQPQVPYNDFVPSPRTPESSPHGRINLDSDDDLR